MVSLDCACQQPEQMQSKRNDTIRRINTAVIGCVILFIFDFVKIAVGYMPVSIMLQMIHYETEKIIEIIPKVVI